jgi:hypothetical protein
MTGLSMTDPKLRKQKQQSDIDTRAKVVFDWSKTPSLDI